MILEQTVSLEAEQAVERYFQTFNQGEFETTANLFTGTGQLLPPFEEPVIGPEAIHAYLKSEAEGMQAFPKDVTVETLDGDRQRVLVKGHVKAIIFQVNTAWIFELDSQGNIEQVEVKLLASLQELLTLRS